MSDIIIRNARAGDVAGVAALDARNTGMEKPDFWTEMFARYGNRPNRFFLIADDDGEVAGFIIGEIRAWEFGSPPSGWIFAIGVNPDKRLKKIGSRLYGAIRSAFMNTGVKTMRTMLARDDELNMAFFRSQGMMAGPFIQLESPLGGLASDHPAPAAEDEAP